MKKNKGTIPDLDALENLLSYKFSDRALLERAITHRSWAHEQVAPDRRKRRAACITSVRVLRDSVLGLIIANYLFQSYRK